MKRILMSLLVIGAVMALVSGGTLAYFSDTETSDGNLFTAETLNLQVSDSDPLTDHFVVANVKPGDSGSKDWDLKNTGTLAGSLDISFSNLVDLENTVNEAEAAATAEDGTVSEPGTNGELAEALTVLIYIDADNSDSNNTGDTVVYNGPASGIVGERLSNYSLAASPALTSIRIEWSVNGTGVENEIQSDSAGFDITFELLQIAD